MNLDLLRNAPACDDTRLKNAHEALAIDLRERKRLLLHPDRMTTALRLDAINAAIASHRIVIREIRNKRRQATVIVFMGGV